MTGSGYAGASSGKVTFFVHLKGWFCCFALILCSITLASVRECVSYVPQDGGLVRGTVLSNICYGSDRISDSEAAMSERALSQAPSEETADMLDCAWQAAVRPRCRQRLSFTGT